MAKPLTPAATVLACLFAATLAGACARAEEVAPSVCETPDNLRAGSLALPNVAVALRPGNTLSILAVGSATMLGTHGGPDRSLAHRVVDALRAATPRAVIRLTIDGGHGTTAVEMLGILRRELAARRYQLVLWQTGTVDALRNAAPDAFRRTLAEGVDLARRAGTDLILIDPQFSRILSAKANLPPYEQAIQQVATQSGVVLFPRYDLTDHWVRTGQIDIEHATLAQRPATFELLNTCLGTALARLVLRGAGLGAS